MMQDTGSLPVSFLRTSMRRGVIFVALAATYFVAAKLGLRLAFVHPSATPVWPPTGIALAAFLLLGYRVWPAILVAAFAANLTTAGSLLTSIGIGVGNTLEGLVGAYLVNRFANGRYAFERARDTFKFAALAATLSTTLSATTGVTVLALGGFAPWSAFGPIWVTWWLGDAAGDLVVAPLLILWGLNRRVHWDRARYGEAALLLVALAVVGLTVFGNALGSQARHYPLEFLCMPFLIWAAFRFGPREAATVLAMLAAIAVWGTLRGLSPFALPSRNESLLLLQAFMTVTAATTLTLAAVVDERREVERRLHHLAVSDPLTGLANYRQLISALEAEIGRSQRTGRPFAILFLDLDRLKMINDRHGHLVGSRALSRVGTVLRRSCRAMDTAARYGGDEFALILPEADAAAATQVGARVAQRVTADEEKPALTVSIGVGLYPHDGETAEQLLSAADALLYDAKARRRSRSGSRA